MFPTTQVDYYDNETVWGLIEVPPMSHSHLCGFCKSPSEGRPPCSAPHPRMDDEEDDVLEPEQHRWRATFQEIKCEERAAQTPGPVLAPDSGMLPCGVAQEPRPPFHGESRRRGKTGTALAISLRRKKKKKKKKGPARNCNVRLPARKQIMILRR